MVILRTNLTTYGMTQSNLGGRTLSKEVVSTQFDQNCWYIDESYYLKLLIQKVLLLIVIESFLILLIVIEGFLIL